MNLQYYLSMLGYSGSMALCIFSNIDMNRRGFLSNEQRCLSFATLLLLITDFSTIKQARQRYHFIPDSIQQNKKKVFYFFGGLLLVILSSTIIVFELFRFNRGFQSLAECFNSVISLGLGDSVYDMIEKSGQSLIGPFTIMIIVMVIYMSFTNIVISLCTMGFQVGKQQYIKKEKEKKELKAEMRKNLQERAQRYGQRRGWEYKMVNNIIGRYVESLGQIAAKQRGHDCCRIFKQGDNNFHYYHFCQRNSLLYYYQYNGGQGGEVRDDMHLDKMNGIITRGAKKMLFSNYDDYQPNRLIIHLSLNMLNQLKFANCFLKQFQRKSDPQLELTRFWLLKNAAFQEICNKFIKNLKKLQTQFECIEKSVSEIQ